MIEYRTYDKTHWGPGPWTDEPDKRSWTDDRTGLPCLIVRSEMGNLCGYVGVDVSHPCFGQGYNDAAVNVHGGLTFASPCQHGSEATSICHIPEAGKTDNIWWFGFDCAHAFDLVPSFITMGMPSFGDHSVYRDIDYVTKEVEALAQQLAEIKHVSVANDSGTPHLA